MPILFGTLVLIPKGLEQKMVELGISAGIETTQATELLKSARILREILEISWI